MGKKHKKALYKVSKCRKLSYFCGCCVVILFYNKGI